MMKGVFFSALHKFLLTNGYRRNDESIAVEQRRGLCRHVPGEVLQQQLLLFRKCFRLSRHFQLDDITGGQHNCSRGLSLDGRSRSETVKNKFCTHA